MRHRAAELGDQCDYRQTETYREVLQTYDEPLDVVQPTSWAALHFVDRMAETLDWTGCRPAATPPPERTSPGGRRAGTVGGC